ncbi:MAG TPA: ankyrin repeat domain-containing protein, partial [Bacteroidia bacterium]|nr:ankyrin repeat domain-containing protein [Bacteroidia bacterium]
MNSAALFFRTFLLAVFTLSLLAGAIITDYYLRHEVTRKAKRFLAEQQVELTPSSAIKAAREGELRLLEQLELAGVSPAMGDERGFTPLLAAVKAGNVEIVDFLMNRESVKSSINQMTEPERDTPLAAALRDRNFELADRIVSKGAALQVDVEAGLPFLIAAAKSDDREMLDYLLGKGVDVDYQGAQAVTALGVAADREDLALIRRLLEAGADPNVLGVTGKPLVVEAVKAGRRDQFDLLLAHKVDVNARTSDGSGEFAALSHAIGNGDREMRDLLLKAGATPEVAGLGGDPLLVEAAVAGDHELCRVLLDAKAKPEVLSKSGLSPLQVAVAREDLDLVDLLVEKGADPSFAGEGSAAPLLGAVSLGNVGIAGQLIAAGAVLDKQALLAKSYELRDDPLMSLLLHAGADPESTFPGTEDRVFDAAVRDGATGAVRTLLAAGAKIGDNLWAALLTGQDDLIRLILQAGASPRQPGPDGQDPLDYCLTHERYGVARVLLDGGANPDARFDASESWLSKAVREGRSEIALALVEKGATVKGVKASDGHSLIGWAIANKMTDVAIALAKAGIDPDEEERIPASNAFRDKFDSTTFRYHLQVDGRIRPIMMAAAQRNHEVAQALMDAGANGRAYSRKYLSGAIVGSWFKDTRIQQICLLGKVPNPQPRKVVVDLSSQRVTLYENGVATYSTACSTGMSGYRTPTGEYVVSDKNRHHVSNIYHASMPF